MLNWCLPNFETPSLHMPCLSATQAFDHVLACAFTSLVSYLIALEAQFGVAVETFVLIRATQNAVHSLSLVRTFPHHMAKLATSAALYCWVQVQEVSRSLLLELLEHVNIVILRFFC